MPDMLMVLIDQITEAAGLHREDVSDKTLGTSPVTAAELRHMPHSLTYHTVGELLTALGDAGLGDAAAKSTVLQFCEDATLKRFARKAGELIMADPDQYGATADTVRNMRDVLAVMPA